MIVDLDLIVVYKIIFIYGWDAQYNGAIMEPYWLLDSYTVYYIRLGYIILYLVLSKD